MNWNSENSTPIEDIKAMKKMIKNDTGIRPELSFREMLYHDSQTLYLLGYNSEQVNYYVKFFLELEQQGILKKMAKTSKIITKAMVSGGGIQDTRTPLEIFRKLNKEFNFELDPCTSSERENNLGTPFYFTEKQDGLKQDWGKFKSIFINPPWATLLNLKWINKAFSELEKYEDMTIVFLVPSKTETRWYQTLYKSKFLKELRFQKGRITFEGHKGGFIFGISYFILQSKKKGGLNSSQP